VLATIVIIVLEHLAVIERGRRFHSADRLTADKAYERSTRKPLRLAQALEFAPNTRFETDSVRHAAPENMPYPCRMKDAAARKSLILVGGTGIEPVTPAV
jgi:hypothetical protein